MSYSFLGNLQFTAKAHTHIHIHANSYTIHTLAQSQNMLSLITDAFCTLIHVGSSFLRTSVAHTKAPIMHSYLTYIQVTLVSFCFGISNSYMHAYNNLRTTIVSSSSSLIYIGCRCMYPRIIR